MATLYRRGRIWWASGFDRNGQRWQRSTKQTDEENARQVARRFEAELAENADRPRDEACTLELALLELVSFSEAAGRAKDTIEFLKTKSKHLVRLIGPQRLCSAITPAVTSSYSQERIAEGAHRHTVSFEIRVLMQALRRQAKLGKYKPAIEIRDLKPDEVRNAYQPRERWLTPAEYELLLAELDPARRGRTRRRRTKTEQPPVAISDEVAGLGRLDGREAWSEEMARKVLLAWARSGDPMRAFARAHDFKVQRLLWWRDRLGMREELDGLAFRARVQHDVKILEEDRRDYVLVMCQTGVRLKELHAIEAQHVNLARRTLFIAGTKTKGARRTVPVTPSVAAALKARIERFPRGPLFPVWHKVQRDLYAACLRIERAQNPAPRTPGQKAVQNPKGNPSPKRERVRPAIPFDPVTPNDLRRTYASWLAQAGVPMLHAMKLMGHGSTQMLESVYAQLAPEHLHEAVRMLPKEITDVARAFGEDELDQPPN